MAVLKNSDREAVLVGVLSEAFAGRFSDIMKHATELFKTWVKKEHPRFVELIADPSAVGYLAAAHTRPIYYLHDGGTRSFYAPNFGKWASLPEVRGMPYPYDNYSLMRVENVKSPANGQDFYVSDKKLLNVYYKTWEDYEAAHDRLSSALRGYPTREKLAVDFPEFAKFLPALQVKARLPVPVAGDIRKELRKVGVPAK